MIESRNGYKGLGPTLVILETLFFGAMWWMSAHSAAVKWFLRPVVDYLLPPIQSLI